MKKLRIVLDTNVLLSATIGGNPSRILELFTDGKIIVLTSPEIILEVRIVLVRVLKNIEKAIRYVDILEQHAELVKPKEKFDAVKNDPADNKFLECAVAGKADYLVTGDKKQLLPLKAFGGIPIISPKEFLDRLL